MDKGTVFTRTRFQALAVLVLLPWLSWANHEMPMRVDAPADARAIREEEQMKIFSQLALDAGKAVGLESIQVAISDEKAALLQQGGVISSTNQALLAGKILPVYRQFDFSTAPWERPSPEGYMSTTKAGGMSWTIAVESPGADGMRVLFQQMDLPKGVELYIYSLEADPPQVVGPYMGRGPHDGGEFWSGSVAGGQAWIEVVFPDPSMSKNSSLEIGAVGHLGGPVFSRELETDKSEECFLEPACMGGGEFPQWTSLRHAVAQLLFPLDGQFGICTGTLVNSASEQPFLLTGDHCINSQFRAANTEAFWDYHATSCGQTFSNFFPFPRTEGAELLARRSETTGNDFSFLRFLNAPPQGRSYAGYTTVNPANGTTLYRLHHPDGRQLHYTRQDAASRRFNCGGYISSNYTHSIRRLGGVMGGSSGSALLDSQGRITGQLLGVCPGPGSLNQCSTNFDYLDGRFSITYPIIRNWLEETIVRPENDDFAQRTLLVGNSGLVTGTSVHGTKEPGEPNHAGNSGGASVWWAWRAPANGTLMVETCGSSFDTTLAVYTGNSVGSLVNVAANDDACSLQSRVTFDVTEGIEYQIAVDGFNGQTGDIVLRWEFEPRGVIGWFFY
ncbi:MAG: trypsin-like peptidase domain-containing protein [Candidatus Sumerlaeia bacterium]|nr:trypsin-like peptidase domain-containing protein [Candidatus Sumerlaeia bacterium]